MLDKEFIKNKITFIQEELAFLQKYKSCSLQEIVSDYFKHTIIERILERIINDAIDINQHIISEKSKKEIPNDYKETFLLLAVLKVLPLKFADNISKSIGLRNILTHNYRKLDEKLFYNSIKSCLIDYNKYCEIVLRYVKKQNGKNNNK